MSSNSWAQRIVSMQKAGPTLTAAAAASMLDSTGRFAFPASMLKIGDSLVIHAAGIISNAVTTPGTARFDLRLGSTVIFDTGALNLNVVAKSNVPWVLDVDLVVRAVGDGTLCQFWGQGEWTSEAVIASPLPTVGGNGSLNVPVSGLALSTGFNSQTASNIIDSFFTQTVATGSMTCQQFRLDYGT